MAIPQVSYIIADDHPVFRQGLRLVLSDDPALRLQAEAANGHELLEKLRFEQPDVVLLDLKMPGMDGIAATRIIREKYPDVRILILTMHDDEQLILHMLEAGANGYLVKNSDAEEIKLALRACAENGYYFSDRVSTVMLKKVMGKGANPAFSKPALTDRELEILALLCEGLTAVEIGKRIFLSPRTVEGIKAGLLEKTGVRNTAGLIMYAVRYGIIDAH
jgi:DNA-binding NarL/FixJ family response regulator